MVVAGILAFIVALLLSVMIHEAGHFFTARRYGMKATQFFVGFGPTLWSRTRGETEYGIKAIPAGGFVKIVGMTPLEEVPPGDEDRAFYKQPAGRRLVVLSAGSFMHFVITIVLVLVASFAIGRVVEGPPALAATSACVASDATAGCDSPGSVPAPAQAAGVQAGDVVVSVDGTKVKDSEQFVRVIRDKAGVPVSLTVLRDGEQRQLTVTPAAVQRPSLDVPDATERVGAIGVTVQRRIATERVGPVQAIQDSGETMTLIVKGIGVTLTEKLGTIKTLYGNDRDPEGFIGVVGASRISGEVLASQETFGVKVLTFLSIMAGLNFFVGVFNLLPLLPLDGGHIAVLLFEQTRDRIRRIFGYRGALQRVDLNKLMPVTYAVVLLFIGLTFWIMGADIVNPVKLPQ